MLMIMKCLQFSGHQLEIVMTISQSMTAFRLSRRVAALRSPHHLASIYNSVRDT